MTTAVNEVLLKNCRRAILDRFVELKKQPDSNSRYSSFVDIHAEYINGAFQAALDELIENGCIELKLPFLRLTKSGYLEAYDV